VTRSLIAFVVAALFEIAGCFTFWVWVKRGAPPAVALLGVAILAGFAFMLTRIDTPFAGRAYAAYGGVYIASSLGWLWAVERQRPTAADAIGAALAIAGAAIIVSGFGSAQR
jgi:small multidrug resistance family-3 protein